MHKYMAFNFTVQNTNSNSHTQCIKTISDKRTSRKAWVNSDKQFFVSGVNVSALLVVRYARNCMRNAANSLHRSLAHLLNRSPMAALWATHQRLLHSSHFETARCFDFVMTFITLTLAKPSEQLTCCGCYLCVFRFPAIARLCEFCICYFRHFYSVQVKVAKQLNLTCTHI